jgi:hypothetical protein
MDKEMLRLMFKEPGMIDPEVVIAQVQQGNFPPTWQVLRGKAKPRLAGIACGCLMLFPASVLAGMLVIYLSYNTPTAVRAILSHIPHKSLLVVVIAVGAATVIGSLAASRVAKANDGVLVFMPDGVVRCSEYSKPTRSFTVFSYAELSHLAFRTTIATHQPRSQGGITSKYYQYWLDQTYYDGRKESARIDSLYGRPEEISQRIIAGHAQYQQYNGRASW